MVRSARNKRRCARLWALFDEHSQRFFIVLLYVQDTSGFIRNPTGWIQHSAVYLTCAKVFFQLCWTPRLLAILHAQITSDFICNSTGWIQHSPVHLTCAKVFFFSQLCCTPRLLSILYARGWRYNMLREFGKKKRKRLIKGESEWRRTCGIYSLLLFLTPFFYPKQRPATSFLFLFDRG